MSDDVPAALRDVMVGTFTAMREAAREEAQAAVDAYVDKGRQAQRAAGEWRDLAEQRNAEACRWKALAALLVRANGHLRPGGEVVYDLSVGEAMALSVDAWVLVVEHRGDDLRFVLRPEAAPGPAPAPASPAPPPAASPSPPAAASPARPPA